MIIQQHKIYRSRKSIRRVYIIEERQNRERVDKINYYLNLAEEVSKRGTCLRNNYGSVIVNNDEVVSTGYTGAPRGRKNCCDIGGCRRKKHNTASGEGYDKCRSVHSEANAIISPARKNMIGATLDLVGINARNGEYKENAVPCSQCRRIIINAGIKTVIVRDSKTIYRTIEVSSWVEDDDTLED